MLFSTPLLLNAIDLICLYILFSQIFRSRDVSLGNCFFQILPYSRAFVRIIYKKKQKADSPENITWFELGKQNVQANKVY